MDGQDQGIPIYYDGSKPLMSPVTEETSEAAAQPVLPDNEEWRRFIGANPYGSDDQ